MNQQILLIDDSEKIHMLVRAILSKESVDLQSSTDADHGLTIAASICPDLILLDVDMPGMDGFEACKRLKADPATASCPIIFLTSHSDLKEKVHGFGLGAADYVTKPFSPSELLARVHASLHTNHIIRSLEAQAMVDPLTGIGNRVMFMQRMEAEICLRARFHNPLSIIMLDVDHFKDINDTYGHLVGDKVLQIIGKTLTELCRTEDVPCRIGGEEFAIILPQAPCSDAFIVAERICEMLAEKRVTTKGNLATALADKFISVTASFGVADALDAFDRSMMQRADDAMYKAKQDGRNRVCIASKMIEPLAAAA